jgi:hypothetical protein
MERIALQTSRALALVVAGMLTVGQAVAQPPPWAGGAKGEKSGHRKNFEDRKTGGHFGERHRTLVHDYYDAQVRQGRCPPGLAKKDNGCMPPGQAKNWTLGRPLARNVIFHDVPPALAEQLGRPQARHRYAQVDSDILLIERRTGTVLDAIQNLGMR